MKTKILVDFQTCISVPLMNSFFENKSPKILPRQNYVTMLNERGNIIFPYPLKKVMYKNACL